MENKTNLSPELAAQIMAISDIQMEELLPLIVRRCNQLRSDAETLFIFLPNDPQKRVDAFRQIVRSLRARCGISEADSCEP